MLNIIMSKEKNVQVNMRTLATRRISLEEPIVTGIFMTLMIVWACLIEDKRFIFVPLLFLAAFIVPFVSFVVRYVVEPKVAIQADCEGIYFYYKNHKEVYIKLDEIKEVMAYGVWGKWGGIRVTTQVDKYESIEISEDKYALAGKIRFLITTENKEHYLTIIEIKEK